MTAAPGAIRAKNTPYETKGQQHTEGATYNINYGHHELALFHNRPTPAERKEFNHAPVQFALWDNPPALWLAFKFGALDWIDAPYTVHLTPPDARYMPLLLSREQRYPIVMLLVNAHDGNIEALRVATISPETSRQMRRIIEEQKTRPFHSETYNRSLQETMNRLTPAGIAQLAGRAEILGQEAAPPIA